MVTHTSGWGVGRVHRIHETPSQRPVPATHLRTHSMETRVYVSRKSWARKWEAAKIKRSVTVSSHQSWVYNIKSYLQSSNATGPGSWLRASHSYAPSTHRNHSSRCWAIMSKLSTFTQLAMGRHGLGVTSWIPRTVWPESLGTTLKKTMGYKRIIDYINDFQE